MAVAVAMAAAVAVAVAAVVVRPCLLAECIHGATLRTAVS